ncbi:MAG: lipid A biosynthesis acyltransferase [Gallionellales bacterium RIFCSPLOWO2_12_FULL_59_22]|nr:MAG: lipid A biosynthesis acyltransferase [Gallionellales bacterium RIFCSPLOWO2_02_FULL_59_110]OGT05406.1 MAG: lipid A biosynthesis acyltransferase [Gallionellales bacterium RIFCSPLOWO2_02_58_13]OGT10869.1 MAG: lipid A biosynthesis acyltransferase [Gallionellales bacterium RIFCSPLOWO2_12_FULL_59_22]
MNAFLFKTVFRLLVRLPLSVLHSLGALLGRLTYVFSAQYAARTRENLCQAGVTSGEAEYRNMLSATIAETGKAIAELAWIWVRPYDEVVGMVRQCVGLEHIEAARQRGKGIILFTPHLGCFEITSLYASQHVPITALYRPPKLGFLEDIMRSGRERGQVRLARADIGGVRLLYKALKRGEAIGLLPDQVPSRGEGEWADFFGRPAYTMTLIGRLAESSGAAVLIVYAERLPRGQGYAIHFEPLLLDFAVPVPQQVNAALERVIRTCPAQYLWSYNRYKTPRGAQSPATNP